jgi:methylenetetrahydrofolate dehydrogenase (NADP+) / methenyltetrahydrofolate cyclohydrolase
MIVTLQDLYANKEQEVLELRQTLSNKPTLLIVQVGDDFASNSYIAYKKKFATRMDIAIDHVRFESNVSESDISNIIQKTQAEGIIIQLPIPRELTSVLDTIPFTKDIDNLNSTIRSSQLSPTIQSIHDVITYVQQRDITESDNSYSGKNIVVIGQGVLVGRPLAEYFIEQGATVVSCNECTDNIEKLVDNADIIISATGRQPNINYSHIKQGCIVVDAATSEGASGIRGDINPEDIPTHAYLIPSPKGIGPLTVMNLFYSLCRAARNQHIQSN